MQKFTDFQIEFMRQDLISNFSLSNLVEKTKQILKEQGRDFDKEFAEFKRQEDARKIVQIRLATVA